MLVVSNSSVELQTPEDQPRPTSSHHHLPPAPAPATPSSSSSFVSPPPPPLVDDGNVHNSTAHVHVFRSKLPDLPSIPNHLPLHSYIFQHLPERSDNTCLIVGSTGQTYSFGQTHLLSMKVAAGLSNLGIKRGDVIMILLPNCAEFVFTFMAVSMIGATATTANPFYTTGEIFKQFNSANAKLMVTQSQYVDKLRYAGDDKHRLKMGEDYTVITTDDPPRDCLPFSVLSEANELETQALLIDSASTSSFDPNDAVALPYSSGTTGLPKGVVLTHKCLITSVAQQVDGENPNLYLKPEDVFLCVCPLFHIYSLVSILFTSMRTGAAVLLMQKFEIKALLELIERHRVSVAGVVPPLVLALTKSPYVAEYDLSSIRLVLSGAAPLGKELQDALLCRVPQAIFGQGYGMTEAGPVISMSPSFAKQPLPSKSGSCGTPMRNAELKVIDPESGSSLPHNQHGEICMRGSNIMKGYLNDEESTAATIDADGWLHTGDIGYVDEDSEVFIVDRVKELIKFKGFQVAPAELEALLVSHSSIADAAVVPQKDEVAGEVPVAFIVAANGSELTEEAVKEFIAKQVVFYKKLHKVYFVGAIPKSPSGKILRKDLRAKLATLSPLQP